MRAVRVSGFGGLERLAVVDETMPEPAPGQVRVRVHASGLNFSDVLQRQGTYLRGPRPPFISGCEAAGVIEESGERVAVLVRTGAHAEYLVAEREACLALPRALGFEEAAGFPVSYLTAYFALVHAARARRGETVLIHAAGGAFGTAAVQIARALGLQVLAVASSESRRQRVLALGADTALGYDEVRRHHADILLDGVGGAALKQALRVLGPFGRAVLVGWSSGEPAAVDPIGLVFRSHALIGLHLDAVLAQRDRVREAVAQLGEWIEKGELRVQIGCVLPLERIAEGHALLASRDHYGKVVLVP